MPTVFNSQNRAAGSYSSPEVQTNPQTMTNRTFAAGCTGLTPAFLANPANTITLSIMGGFTQPDTSVVWRVLRSEPWTGGHVDKLGNPVVPAINITTTNNLPDLARMDMDLGQATNCGVDLTAS